MRSESAYNISAKWRLDSSALSTHTHRDRHAKVKTVYPPVSLRSQYFFVLKLHLVEFLLKYSKVRFHIN